MKYISCRDKDWIRKIRNLAHKLFKNGRCVRESTGNTRGLVVLVRVTLINIFMKLRQIRGKYYGLE